MIVNKLSWNSATGRQGGTRSTLLHPDSSILTNGLGMTWLVRMLHVRECKAENVRVVKRAQVLRMCGLEEQRGRIRPIARVYWGEQGWEGGRSICEAISDGGGYRHDDGLQIGGWWCPPSTAQEGFKKVFLRKTLRLPAERPRPSAPPLWAGVFDGRMFLFQVAGRGGYGGCTRRSAGTVAVTTAPWPGELSMVTWPPRVPA